MTFPTMPSRSSSPARQALTMVEAVVVVTIIALAAALTVPAIQRISLDAKLEATAGNLRQVVTACRTYVQHSDRIWPCRPTDKVGRIATDSLDQVATTLASLEWLSLHLQGELKPEHLVDHSHPDAVPAAPAKPFTYAGYGISSWAKQGLNASGICYDWGIPVNIIAAVRVVVTNRARGDIGFGKTVLAAYADGHTARLFQGKENEDKGRARTKNLAEASDMGCWYNSESASPEVKDNVFDDVGDYTTRSSSEPAMGSATRAWVR